nr:dehydrocurvularin biosynthesis regulator [Quercus suber]
MSWWSRGVESEARAQGSSGAPLQTAKSSSPPSTLPGPVCLTSSLVRARSTRTAQHRRSHSKGRLLLLSVQRPAMSAPRPMEPDDADPAARWSAKRRKIRKGTRSCWACKTRKEKCVYSASPLPGVGAVCIGCQRRGSQCLSQEYPVELSRPPDGLRQIGDHVVKIEAMVQRLVKKIDHGHAVDANNVARPRAGGDYFGAGLPSLPTPPAHPADAVHEDVKQVESYASDQQTPASTADGVNKPQSPGAPVATSKYAQLIQTLLDALPPQSDREIIYRASNRLFNMFNDSLTVPQNCLDQSHWDSVTTLLDTPGPNSHPVLIARYLLQLANLLQHLHPSLLNRMQSLSEPPRVMMKRLADTAISLVVTQDKLLTSIEGLECVMLESAYNANCGNLRLSWLAGRRAMLLAQSMGFHLSGRRLQLQVLDPKTQADPQYMWFRIVNYDRYLCLLLGLPQGSADRSMATEPALANDIPVGRLERMQCVLAARILDRMESDPETLDFTLTQDLDKELQRAAKSMPSRWWLTPELENSTKDERALFWDVRRLSVQMSHYNLLNKIHLPHMLLFSTEPKYEYSKIACVNASREMLSRFVVLRRFNQIAFSCRTADFLALMAATTLLLAHLDSYRRPSQVDNLLAHLYLSDRAMIEQAQENMEEVSRLNADMSSTQGADLLRRLLVIEAEAANGHTTRAESVSVHTPGTQAPQQDTNGELEDATYVHLPYFGVITFARETISSRSVHQPIAIQQETSPLGHQVMSATPDESRLEDVGAVKRSVQSAHPASMHNVAPMNYSGRDQPYPTVQPPIARLPPGLPSDLPPQGNFTFNQTPQQMQQNGCFGSMLPGLDTSRDDWTFQGIDMAFFDNLMRATEDDGNFGARSIRIPVHAESTSRLHSSQSPNTPIFDHGSITSEADRPFVSIKRNTLCISVGPMEDRSMPGISTSTHQRFPAESHGNGTERELWPSFLRGNHVRVPCHWNSMKQINEPSPGLAPAAMAIRSPTGVHAILYQLQALGRAVKDGSPPEPQVRVGMIAAAKDLILALSSVDDHVWQRAINVRRPHDDSTSPTGPR